MGGGVETARGKNQMVVGVGEKRGKGEKRKRGRPDTQ